MSCAATDISWPWRIFDGAWNTEQGHIRTINNRRLCCDGRRPDRVNIVPEECRKEPRQMHHSSVWLQSSYQVCSHMTSCALYVSYVLTLALINHLHFFSSIVFPSSVVPDSFCHTTPWSWTTCTSCSLLSCNLSFFFFFFTTMKPLHMLFSLLVGDCRVHCSTSSNGGQWPWDSLFIRWAGFLPSFPYSQRGPWCWAGISDHRPKKLLDCPTESNFYLGALCPATATLSTLC